MPHNLPQALLPFLLGGVLLLSACTTQQAVPVWPAPTTNITQHANAAGLDLLPEEGVVEHIHAHLTITLDGRQIEVPAHIGIDTKKKAYSEIHTHDTSGIIHIESPYVSKFYLSQFFTEWSVPLHAHGVGNYSNDNNGVKVTVFVNGKKYTGDLRTLQLQNLQDIVIAITTDGSTPQKPAPFKWPQNYLPQSMR